MNSKLEPIQSLWIGSSLSKVEQLCIKSFLDNGHEFHLYTYGSIDNIPAGTTIRDGSEILSEDKIFRLNTGSGTGSLAGFADVFRLNLLFKRGGWWVDTDVVCLQPFNLEKEVVICTSNDLKLGSLPNNCILKFPTGHKALEFMLKTIGEKDLPNTIFGELGPFLIQQTVKELHLEEYLVPYYYFNPIFWGYVGPKILGYQSNKRKLKDALRPIFKPSTAEGLKIHKDSYAVHLWNEIWRLNGFDKNDQHPRNSLFEQLKRKYNV